MRSASWDVTGVARGFAITMLVVPSGAFASFSTGASWCWVLCFRNAGHQGHAGNLGDGADRLRDLCFHSQARASLVQKAKT